VAIADGLLVFDGPPADFSGERVAWRFGTALPPGTPPGTFYLSTLSTGNPQCVPSNTLFAVL